MKINLASIIDSLTYKNHEHKQDAGVSWEERE